MAEHKERNLRERFPICGMCWAKLYSRISLRYDHDTKAFVCPNCGAYVLDPDEGDRTATEIREMLIHPTPAELRERAECLYPNGDRAPLTKPGSRGGSKSGRKRKKEFPKGRTYTPEQDAALIAKHNAHVRKKQVEGRV